MASDLLSEHGKQSNVGPKLTSELAVRPAQELPTYSVFLVKDFGPASFVLVGVCESQTFDLELDLLVRGLLPQLPEVLHGVFATILTQQPPWRFGQQWQQKKNQHRDRELQANGYLPASVGSDLLRSKGYQRRHDLPEDDHELYRRTKHAAQHSWGCLSLVYWDYDDSHAGHGVRDDASDGELGWMSSGRLQSSAAGEYQHRGERSAECTHIKESMHSQKMAARRPNFSVMMPHAMAPWERRQSAERERRTEHLTSALPMNGVDVMTDLMYVCSSHCCVFAL